MSRNMQDPNQETLDSIAAVFHQMESKWPFEDIGSILGADVPQEMDPGNGQVQPVGFIAENALDDIAVFASGLRPPQIVDTLPTLPDADYEPGQLVFLTSDGKLYRNVSDSWTAEIAAVDLTGQITGTQIADDSISTPKLQALAVTAAKIAAGTITADKIAANSLTAGVIAAGAIGTSELAADAVIANVANVGDTVLIDDTGITISDGALTLQDAFGSNVLSGAGFGASWMDFLASRIYNNAFVAGTTTNITAATLVNSAATDSDYSDSISSDLPYWVVESESGAGTFKRVSDSNASSGFALEWDGNESASIFQDIPIVPGQGYTMFATWKMTLSSATFNGSVSVQYRTKTHGAIGVAQELGLLYDTTISSYITQEMITAAVAPANARYLRIGFTVARASGSPNVRLAALAVKPTDACSVATQSSDLTLTGTTTDVPGCSLSLTPGTYLITGIFDAHTSPAGSDGMAGRLYVDGVGQSTFAIYQSVDGRSRGTVAWQWKVKIGSTVTVKLRADIFTGSTGTITLSQSMISAIRVGG